ncbi:GNAT family N-acetyltransferase [Acidaminobacter sp. JC074]|uniref:GNAT family N-acetyltransferase n=1 Tax=Acidaminobacter sp. JC074 TaxID=2530199 RepID=UPI001F100512|nr:GNAT family protein [Acidaminobacter sp. JC074]MCH4890824.1 GNAT family N-acetyltransferase [Acidaminobacter sp. JC074]
MVRLETKRLYIRDLMINDLEAHHDLISNDEVMYYIQDIQTHSYEASRENLVFSIDEAHRQDRKCYFFGIFLKENNEHVGSVGFTLLEKGDSGNAELGYFIHKKFWHKGYTFEASKAVVDYAFEMGIQKITTGCVYLNNRSENIMKKLGMFKEGHLYKHTYIDGRWLDRVTYGHYNPRFLNDQERLQLVYVRLANWIGPNSYHFTGYNPILKEIEIDFLYDEEVNLVSLFKNYKLSNCKQGYQFQYDDYLIKCHINYDKSDFFEGENIEVRHFVPLRFKLTNNIEREE